MRDVSVRQKYFVTLYFLVLLNLVSAQLVGEGENVCSSNKHHRYEYTYYCCEGYIEVGGKCEACEHGNRVGRRCVCVPNFGGAHCNKTCPLNTFGLDCEHNCACLTDAKCNQNYTFCTCKSGEMRTECLEICNCRTNLCSAGFLGKNCTVLCPGGTYGVSCLQKCTCHQNGTLECNNESGDCKCKPNFYGVRCENECTGDLECKKNSINCTCRQSLVQKLDELMLKKAHLDYKFEETKNHFEQQMNDVKKRVIYVVVTLLCLILVIYLIITRYMMKTKKLKRDFKIISMRYSNESAKFGNPFYDQSHHSASHFNHLTSSTDSTKTDSATVRSFIIRSKNNIATGWHSFRKYNPSNLFNLKRNETIKDLIDQDKPIDSEMYCSVQEQ